MTVLDTFVSSASDATAVMDVLQKAVNGMTRKNAPIAREMRIDRYFVELRAASDLDLLVLGFTINDLIGVDLSIDDWKFLTGQDLCKSKEEWETKYAPMFTFGRLADLIASRAKLGTIRPATIMGATSLSAGAFKRIEMIAREIDKRIASFAPSTPILDRFRGRKLRQFWARLRALSGNRVPSMVSSKIDRALEWLGGLSGILLCLFFYGIIAWELATLIGLSPASQVTSWWFVFAFPPVALFVSTRLLLLVVDRIRPPSSILPNGIETFRDLAMLVAGERGGWCEKCGYDLTGLTSARCPECGTEVAKMPLPFSGKNG